MVEAQKTWAGYARSLLRIFAGFTFSQHGFQKLLGFFGGLGGSGAKAVFPTLPWFAGFLELLGGLLILVGLFTRPVAFISAVGGGPLSLDRLIRKK